MSFRVKVLQVKGAAADTSVVAQMDRNKESLFVTRLRGFGEQCFLSFFVSLRILCFRASEVAVGQWSIR